MQLIIVGVVCLVIGIFIGLAIPLGNKQALPTKIDGVLYASSRDNTKLFGINLDDTEPEDLAKMNQVTLRIDRESDL